MVRNPPPGPDGQEIRMVGPDCAIIMNPKVWVASGHVGGFSDPMVDCLKCRKRYREDKVYVVRCYKLAEVEAKTASLRQTYPSGVPSEDVQTLNFDPPHTYSFTVETDSGGGALDAAKA